MEVLRLGVESELQLLAYTIVIAMPDLSHICDLTTAQLVSMRTQVQSLASLSGLRIWHCHGLWCRLQMWLGSCIAVTVV